jgi:acylphosphatase
VIEIRVTTSYAEISPALAGLCALGYEDFMAGNEQNTRVRLRIRGRVQGVAFRAYATEEALRRGVKGWVRNCPDGSVELVAEGNRREVDELVAWCRQGPPSARVDHMDVQPEDFKAKFRDFRVKG